MRLQELPMVLRPGSPGVEQSLLHRAPQRVLELATAAVVQRDGRPPIKPVRSGPASENGESFSPWSHCRANIFLLPGKRRSVRGGQSSSWDIASLLRFFGCMSSAKCFPATDCTCSSELVAFLTDSMVTRCRNESISPATVLRIHVPGSSRKAMPKYRLSSLRNCVPFTLDGGADRRRGSWPKRTESIGARKSPWISTTLS